MPWELIIVNYDGVPPRQRKEADKTKELPLGSLDEVREHISKALPGIEWTVEPPLIEMMKANGSDLWKEWDAETIAARSKPNLSALYESGDLTIEMFGFGHEGPLRFVLLDVRGNSNPIPALVALCQGKGWSIAEMSRDGEFLDLDGGSQRRWEDWQEYLNRAIHHTN